MTNARSLYPSRERISDLAGMWRLSIWLLAGMLVVSPCLAAGETEPDAGRSPAASDVWQSWGGEASWRFNTDVLAAMGLHIDAITGASANTTPAPGHAYHLLRFPAQTTGALTFHARGQKLDSLVDGALQYRGGFRLRWSDGTVDLRSYALRPHAGEDEPFMMEVVDSHGQALFLIDHAHYSLSGDGSELSLRNMNIRVSPALAARMGRPNWAMRTIGGMDVVARVTVRPEQGNAGADVCVAPWPTEAASGQVTNISVYQKYQDKVQAMRCHLPGDGHPELGAVCPQESTDGLVVIAPDSSLLNAGDTAVPWYRKFNSNQANQGGQPQPPYSNDQHPFLVWNMYRIDTTGAITQIGKSAVKHAFWAGNIGCSCSNPHVIYPQCRDTYSVSNNDSNLELAPRTEMIPALGIWGRCGSVYDRDCDGLWDRDDHGAPLPGAANDFDLRLVASEDDLLPAANPAARYFFEYWYLVRDDANIHDTMGYREVSPRKEAGGGGKGDWYFSAQALVLGPAINVWVNPGAPGIHQVSQELPTAEGHVRVAVQVEDLGAGRWRYRYAVMNLDFARAVIDPAHATEPNLKLLSNAGFSGFDVPLPSGVTAQEMAFTDADRDVGNAWSPSIAGDGLRWRAPGSGAVASNTLDWGTLYSFTFVASTPPGPADVSLHVATTKVGLPTSYVVASLGPLSDLIFADGYEP